MFEQSQERGYQGKTFAALEVFEELLTTRTQFTLDHVLNLLLLLKLNFFFWEKTARTSSIANGECEWVITKYKKTYS